MVHVCSYSEKFWKKIQGQLTKMEQSGKLLSTMRAILLWMYLDMLPKHLWFARRIHKLLVELGIPV